MILTDTHSHLYDAKFAEDRQEMIACAFEEGVERIFILSSKELKDRFLKEITALSQIFAMSIPSFEADVIKDDVAFFQAVKARINKFNPSGVKSNYEIDTAIKQIVDEALSSDGVIDVFEPAGIKTPDISILSDELGLTDDQYAFYSVLNLNDSTKMLDDHKMKELIHHIVDVIRENATVAGVREVM